MQSAENDSAFTRFDFPRVESPKLSGGILGGLHLHFPIWSLVDVYEIHFQSKWIAYTFSDFRLFGTCTRMILQSKGARQLGGDVRVRFSLFRRNDSRTRPKNVYEIDSPSQIGQKKMTFVQVLPKSRKAEISPRSVFLQNNIF